MRNLIIYGFIFLLMIQLCSFLHAEDYSVEESKKEKRKPKKLSKKEKKARAHALNEVTHLPYSFFFSETETVPRPSKFPNSLFNVHTKEKLLHLEPILQQLNLDTKELIQAPLTENDYYFIPLTFLPLPVFKEAQKQFSSVTWHDQLDIDQRLSNSPKCNEGLWMELKQNLTHAAMEADKKLIALQNLTKNGITLSQALLKEFPSFDGIHRLFVLNHDLRLFIKKMYQYCKNIDTALEGPVFFLREPTLLLYQHNDHLLRHNGIDHLKRFLNKDKEYLLSTLTLHHSKFKEMHEWYISIPTVQQAFATWARYAKEFSGKGFDEFQQRMVETGDKAILHLKQWYCLRKNVLESEKQFSTFFHPPEPYLSNTLQELHVEMFWAVAVYPELKVLDTEFKKYELKSPNHEYSYLFEFDYSSDCISS